MIQEIPLRILFVYGTLQNGSRHPMAHRLRAAAAVGRGRRAASSYDRRSIPAPPLLAMRAQRVVGEVALFATAPAHRRA
jgi:gamma-glutamylcyclotransferase (GGCT)/AIG2-like uncharacterized protein YtfP